MAASCGGKAQGVNRASPDSGTVQSNFDSGSGLPDASTTGQTQVVVLPDGAVIQVTVQADGGIQLPPGLALDGGLSGGLFSLKCDAGSITVSGTPKTLQCRVLLQDGSEAQNVVWVSQDTLVGSIGPDGIFRANGLSGGVFEVTALVGSATIKTQITVDFVLQENSGGVSTGDMAKLVAGGSQDSSFAWLYPYDKTVFPRGLPPPELQFAGACTDATYTKISTSHFLYEQFAAATPPTRVKIPDTVWKGLTLSAGPTTWVDISVTKLCSGQATGPKSEAWLIAPGNMKGVVYYNAYRAYSLGLGQGGILRLRLGSQAEALLGDCTVCHSVSANGEALAAQIDWRGQPPSNVYDLTTGSVPPPVLFSQAPTAERPEGWLSFCAFAPDGKRLFTNGTPTDTSLATPRTGPQPQGSVLVDLPSGNTISTPSLQNIGVKFAQLPIFSPDGKHIAFNHSDLGDTRHLAVMDYDGAQNPPVFSNLRDVASDPTLSLSWPSFIPDSGAVVYQQGIDFETTTGRKGDLRFVDIGAGQVNPLAALNGYLPNGDLYLPGGTGQDDHVNYEPSVMPRPIGGYYWVMFASRRIYGNYLAPGGSITNSGTPWSDYGGGIRKKIWVSAVDIDYSGKIDPSHPAFFLPGQAMDSGSLRPFVALEPCKPEGASCESGVDCCAGYCRETGRDMSGNPILQCVPPPTNSCSNLDEVCVTPADCCDQTNLCIVGRCALPTPRVF
ncbi:MAG TPA: hypothetical protein VGJ84_20535 [Polyangiaceae bacterium]